MPRLGPAAPGRRLRAQARWAVRHSEWRPGRRWAVGLAASRQILVAAHSAARLPLVWTSRRRFAGRSDPASDSFCDRGAPLVSATLSHKPPEIQVIGIASYAGV